MMNTIMEKNIILNIKLTDDLGIKSVEITNNTQLKTDSDLLVNIAYALLKAKSLNKDSLLIQDMLSDVGVTIPKEDK